MEKRLHFGYRLKHMRQAAGISQRQLADMVNAVSPGTTSQSGISLIEQRPDPPRGDFVNIISDLFQVHPIEFYTTRLDRLPVTITVRTGEGDCVDIVVADGAVRVQFDAGRSPNVRTIRIAEQIGGMVEMLLERGEL